MILVDTSVWIDFFRGEDIWYRHALHNLIEDEEDICLTVLILTELLQGIKRDSDYRAVKGFLLDLPIFSPKDIDSYSKAAEIYRACRKKGITIRRTLDCLIAQTAIDHDLCLLHNDRDFDLIASAINKLKIYSVPHNL